MERTLVYIDPDAATGLLVSKALSSEGFRVVHARTALDGEQSAACLRPDLVLVNVDRVKAAEVVPALRQSPGLEQLRLLASTAHVWPEHLEKMLAWGFDRVLLKPLDVDTLGGELASALPAPPAAEGSAEAPAPSSVAEPGPDPIESIAEAPAPEAVPASLTEAPAGTGVGAEAAAPIALAPVEVPPLWRLALMPLMAGLVRSTASAEGFLALLDEDARALVVAAAASSRRSDDGDWPVAGVLIGTRVAVGAAPWLHPALRARQAVELPADGLSGSPLALPGNQTLLIVPVASPERLYGVAVLGKHRAARVPAYSPGKVSRSFSQARHIAGVVEMLRALDRGTEEKRLELQRLRLGTLRTLLTEMAARAKQSRRNGPERAHADPDREGSDGDPGLALGLRLAERLGLPARQREILRQALQVRDIGRAWVEQVLFARAGFPLTARERLLEAHGQHGAEILSALEWPPAVVELVRHQRPPADLEGRLAGVAGADIPVEARIMAAVGAMAESMAGEAGETDEAFIDLGLSSADPDPVHG